LDGRFEVGDATIVSLQVEVNASAGRRALKELGASKREAPVLARASS